MLIMSNNCCVGDADFCPKNSSCSMVLRSSCSHRHSRESSTAKEYLHSSAPRKRKHSSFVSEHSYNGNLHLQSLELSLKELALKSAVETYSILTEPLYNSFELSDSASQKVFETSLNVSCAKELHFSQISTLNNSSICQKNINNKESRSDYSSAADSDMGESIDSNSNMSRARRITRSSVRSFSSSEDDDISVQSIIRPRGGISQSNSNFTTSKPVLLNQEVNSQNNNHFYNDGRYSRFSGGSDGGNLTHSESSYQDRSTVQYSLFNRFRWFLWRCTYLKIIKIVSWDVWFLSRLHNYGKLKAIFLLLLTLLPIVFWSCYQSSSFTHEPLSQTFPISSVFRFFSSVFSTIIVFFQKKEEVMIADTDPILHISDSSWGFLDDVFSWFVKEESASLKSENYQSKESIHHYTDEIKSIHHYMDEIKSIHHHMDEIKSIQLNKEEIKILASEVIKDEIKSLKEFLQTTMQATEANKLERDQKLQQKIFDFENEIQNLHLEFQSLTRTVEELKLKQSENETKVDVIALKNEYKDQIEQLNVKLKASKLSALESIKTCCNNKWSEQDILELLEKHLLLALKKVVDGESDPYSKYHFFNAWLSSKFFSQEKLMQEINAALKEQATYSNNEMKHDDVVKIVESTISKHLNDIKSRLSELNRLSYASFSTDMFTEDKIKKIVKEAIMLYDADKIGQVDYALESGGGSVLGTRCSETYSEQYGKLSIFGLPLWTNLNSPRTAIQPEVQPGRCWAFKGSQGFLVIELSATIYPTGFTLEHIPVSISPAGDIDSAPKNISVWGLDSEKDSKGNLLGKYWYDINKDEPLQYFAVQEPSEKPYSYVELQIHSNHGNLNYTCLYRFRVHGKRIS